MAPDATDSIFNKKKKYLVVKTCHIVKWTYQIIQINSITYKLRKMIYVTKSLCEIPTIYHRDRRIIYLTLFESI